MSDFGVEPGPAPTPKSIAHEQTRHEARPGRGSWRTGLSGPGKVTIATHLAGELLGLGWQICT